MVYISSFISSENISLIISVLSFIISGLTLLLGYKAYRKFLVQHASVKQLDLVLNLIEEIHNSEVSLKIIRRVNEGQGTTYVKKNIFGFATWGNLKEKEEYDMHIPSDHKFEFIPLLNLNNPLLPKGIANSIKEFYDHFILEHTELKEKSNYIIIGDEDNESSNDLNDISLTSFYGGLNQFIVDCKYIRLEINKWLKKHGVKDINSNIIDREFSFF